MDLTTPSLFEAIQPAIDVVHLMRDNMFLTKIGNLQLSHDEIDLYISTFVGLEHLLQLLQKNLNPGVSNSDPQNYPPGGRGRGGEAALNFRQDLHCSFNGYSVTDIRLAYLVWLIQDGATFGQAVDAENQVSLSEELEVLKREGLI